MAKKRKRRPAARRRKKVTPRRLRRRTRKTVRRRAAGRRLSAKRRRSLAAKKGWRTRRALLKVWLVTFHYDRMKNGKVVAHRETGFLVDARTKRQAKNYAQRWTKRMQVENNKKHGWKGQVPWSKVTVVETKRKAKKAGRVIPRD